MPGCGTIPDGRDRSWAPWLAPAMACALFLLGAPGSHGDPGPGAHASLRGLSLSSASEMASYEYSRPVIDQNAVPSRRLEYALAAPLATTAELNARVSTNQAHP